MGFPGTGNGQFSNPIGVAVDSSGNVYVTDANNNRVQKFTSTGNYITQWGHFGNQNGNFTSDGVAVDSSGNVYVADMAIIVFRSSRAQALILMGVPGNNEFTSPIGVAVDARGTCT